jgi:queuine tRNA-ribosyltransferase
MARTGTVLTRDGRLVVKNREFAEDWRPLDDECGCPVCARHSRAYIRHLFQSREILAATLATLHNLHYYQELMAEIRAAIAADRYGEFARTAAARWTAGEERRLDEVRRRDA